MDLALNNQQRLICHKIQPTIKILDYKMIQNLLKNPIHI